MKSLFIASECVPFAKTGGLADVVGALPAVLAARGCEVRVLLPGYRDVIDCMASAHVIFQADDLFGGRARVLSGEARGIDLLLADATHLYDRDGSLYQDPDRRDWTDNHLRFAALAWLGARIGLGSGADGWRPDLVHAHDWQAGLAPLYLRGGTPHRPASLCTIHNIAYQGVFPERAAAEIELPAEGFNLRGYEFYGDISFLKAGLVYADAITTVSPTYARELRDPAFGMRLDGVIRERWDRVFGILNGIDTSSWDPATDPCISTFTPRKLSARRANKLALATEFGLSSDPDRPLFSVVSRLTGQKGLDLLVEALPEFLNLGGDLVLLGTGDSTLERRLCRLGTPASGTGWRPDRI